MTPPTWVPFCPLPWFLSASGLSQPWVLHCPSWVPHTLRPFGDTPSWDHPGEVSTYFLGVCWG